MQLQRPQSHRMALKLGPLAAGLLLLLAALSSAAFFIDKHQSPTASEWNYSDQAAWARHGRECVARAQSPIDIQQRNVIISQHLRLRFFNYNRQLRFKLSNAHHTIKMSPQGANYEPAGLAGAHAQRSQQHQRLQHEPADSLNFSSIHDIITADEYVEFAPQVPVPHSSGAAGVDSQAGSSNPISSSHSSPTLKLSQRGRNNERLVGLPDAEQSPAAGRLNKQGRARQMGRQPATLEDDSLTVGQPASGADSANSVEDDSLAELAYEGAPTIKLDWLDDGNNEYKLRDIHFHWAERRDNGSEHAIDGRRAAMEMHLVHIKRGLDKSKIGFTSDSVAVIAILIESHRKSNADFNPIVNELARINATEQAQLIDYKSIYDLLPSSLDAFYTYSGSLTTPPCYQVVNWIVMAERLNMNAKQIEMFRNLYAPAPHEPQEGESAGGHENEAEQERRNQSLKSHSGEESEVGELTEQLEPARGELQSKMIMPNVRALQPLNNRTILASFTRQGGRLKAYISHSDSLHKRLRARCLLANVVYVLCLLLSIISMARSNHIHQSSSSIIG